MELSYWEYKTWFKNIDYAIIGSGIVGLTCAIALKKKFPKAKVVVLERGVLPHGASTKNAGFACFGSVSEILADLQNHTTEEVQELVEKRYLGLAHLKHLLGEKAIGYQQNGNYELFFDEASLYPTCMSKIQEVNALLFPIFKREVFTESNQSFGFKGVQKTSILNTYEGQIDTGLMMKNLISIAYTLGITIFNGIEVKALTSSTHLAHIETNYFDINAQKVCVATNGFASQLLNLDVTPVRNQVIITEKVPDLSWNTCFHLEEGFYYVRNIDQRILVGGGRHLDKVAETTQEFGTTELIQNQLETLLHEVIHPQRKLNIKQRWSGILGVGNQKKPIIDAVHPTIYAGVRLGGMGVAMGSLVGQELANLASS